jgi:serine/threonine protein kinase
MAKLYGERWKTGDALGQGGQGQVFRAVDTSGEYAGEFALKRIINPHRHQRFRNEIEAIKKLHHPNVIRLIDHSALDDPSSDEKQFMVMPIAAGGDLSSAGRLSLYPTSPDSIVVVAKQIAGALTAAHAAHIVHRDIKPQNILFTGNGHETWLSDFGICLLRENPRSTDSGEVVGPRACMAPELEDGGKLHVTPAADIYSFGKVIYYMITGGTVLPRERMHEAQYSRVFSQGERFRLLEALLQQMICPLERRLQKMTDVIERLEKIEAWEKKCAAPFNRPAGSCQYCQAPTPRSRNTACDRCKQRSARAGSCDPHDRFRRISFVASQRTGEDGCAYF